MTITRVLLADKDRGKAKAILREHRSASETAMTRMWARKLGLVGGEAKIVNELAARNASMWVIIVDAKGWHPGAQHRTHSPSHSTQRTAHSLRPIPFRCALQVYSTVPRLPFSSRWLQSTLTTTPRGSPLSPL